MRLHVSHSLSFNLQAISNPHVAVNFRKACLFRENKIKIYKQDFTAIESVRSLGTTASLWNIPFYRTASISYNSIDQRQSSDLFKPWEVLQTSSNRCLKYVRYKSNDDKSCLLLFMEKYNCLNKYISETASTFEFILNLKFWIFRLLFLFQLALH